MLPVRYTKGMNEKSIHPLYYAVDVGGVSMKVFVVGGSPRIKRRVQDQQSPDGMRGTHTHFTYEAFFVTAGKLKLITRDFVGSYERSIVIVPPRHQHHSLPEQEGSFCLLLAPEEGTSAETVWKNRIGDEICTLPLEEDIAFYIDRLARRRGENSPTAARDAELLAALICNRLLAHLLPTESAPRRQDLTAAHIGRIENYINSHLTRKFTLADVARAVYLSTRQVARIIEKAYGCSFSELVTDKRLSAAEMMLKSTDLRVSEIAATFCTSEAYFFVLFKKKYGISPLKYRKESRIVEKNR